MTVPDKLPLSSIAIMIAAAVQASPSPPIVLTACVWSVVILAIIIEFTSGIVKQNVNWKRSQKCGAWLIAAILGITSFSWLVSQAYRKEFLTENLRVNISLPHPGQLGTDRVDFNYSILNKGLEPLFIEEISDIEIATTDISLNFGRNGELCKQQGLYFPRGMMEMWPRPALKVWHDSMDRPILPTSPFAYGPLPFADDKKLDVAIYNPDQTTVFDHGKVVPGVPISIEAEKATSIAASFDTDPANWDAHNVLVVCGAIKFLRNDGVQTWAICHPWVLARMYKDEKPAGDLTSPRIASYFAGLPENQCDVRDHWPI